MISQISQTELTQQNSRPETSAQVPFDNNTNVISKAVLYTPNEPRFGDSIDFRFEDQQEVHQSKLQPVNTSKQSAISERLSKKQVAQNSFDDQVKEYIQKHKRSCLEKYEKKSNPTQKKLYHPQSRRRLNRTQKGPGCGQHSTISSDNLNRCPEKKYNFHIITSNRHPPDWNNYLKLAHRLTTSYKHLCKSIKYRLGLLNVV